MLYVDIEQLRDIGEKIARNAAPGDVVALIGDLGTGKTTLAGAIAKGLGIEGDVTSPSFTIVNEYYGGRLPLYHYDVYRLNSPEDLFEIGYEEHFYGDGLTVVEWADLIEELLPETAKPVRLGYAKDEDMRTISCEWT